jgi:tetratricopeptide (TPR) repeat protein
MRLAPTDAELLSDVGYSYYLQRRLDEAEKTLRRALELKPGDPKACNNLAIVCGETGRYQESLALFQQSGSDAEAYANLAFIYAQQGKLQQAKAAYDRALSLNPGLRPAAEAMVQLAQYGETKRPATAVDRATPPQPRRAGNVVPASAEMAEAIPPQPHPPAPPSSTSTAAPEEGWSRASDGARTAGRGPAPAEPAATGDSAPPPTSSEQTDLWTGLKHSIAAAANRP